MPTRRGLIGAALAGAAGVLATASSAVAKAPRPVSKAKARYQDKPKDIQNCASCAQFKAPDKCKVVIGKVSPDGWCRLFEMVD